MEKVLKVILVIVGALIFGVFNRIRGGYRPWPGDCCELPDPPFPHDSFGRMFFAVPFGLLVAYLVGRGKHRWWAGLFALFFTYFSLWIGWGCYFAIGRNPNAWEARAGAYDWLIGRDCEDFTFEKRWVRDFVGMSLRGLAWTLPLGMYLELHHGWTWDYSMGGLFMGSCYELTHHIYFPNPNFGKGTPMGEFVWGNLLFCFTLVAWSGRSPVISWGKWKRVAVFVVWLVFSVSLPFYYQTPTTDPRNKNQTLVGLVCVMLSMPLVWISRPNEHAEDKLEQSAPRSWFAFCIRALNVACLCIVTPLVVGVGLLNHQNQTVRCH